MLGSNVGVPPEEASIQVAPFRKIGKKSEVTVNQTESEEGGGSTTNAAEALRTMVSSPGPQERVERGAA